MRKGRRVADYDYPIGVVETSGPVHHDRFIRHSRTPGAEEQELRAIVDLAGLEPGSARTTTWVREENTTRGEPVHPAVELHPAELREHEPHGRLCRNHHVLTNSQYTTGSELPMT